jgi:hypothetical protein
MFKSEIEFAFDNFKAANAIALAAFGEYDWNVSTTVSRLYYEGDEEIESMSACIQTTIDYDGQKLVIDSTGSREVFCSEFGHYEFDHQPFDLVFTQKNGSELKKNEFFSMYPALQIDNNSINYDAITIFSLIPCTEEKAKKFKGDIAIQ